MGLSGDLCVLCWVLVGEPELDCSCGAWGRMGRCGDRGRCRAGEGVGADAGQAKKQMQGR